jgi:hypothetical protein
VLIMRRVESGSVRVPERMLAAIGRMTVAATELEYLLAWIGADQEGDAFAEPGSALRAARDSVQFAPPAYREEFIAAVEGAATQLARGQHVLRSLWREEAPADPARFDDVTTFLQRTRDTLEALVETSGVAR